MTRQIYVDQSTKVVQAYVNHNNTWKHPNAIYVNDGGIWRQTYPDESSSLIYTVPGVYLFEVPMGITTINASVYGAGGGGGAPYFPGGDGWVGGGGSSGGYIENQSFSVIPGNFLQVIVGQGGAGGIFVFAAFVAGLPGGDSQITGLLKATGGGGGGPGLGSNGPAGSPNGVQGAEPCNPGLCGYGFNQPRPGGNNFTGYGTGGNGGFFGGNAENGGNGAVIINWTATV
jgi:hypothetical protein